MKKVFLFAVSTLMCTVAFSQNVGIGIINPAFKLDVRNGSINVDSVYRIDSITVLAVPGTSNLFVGRNAGRNNTGYNNTFSGESAGALNTTGYENAFFGHLAGYNNSSGLYNSFFGYSAGAYNTSGMQNSCFGHTAGYFNTIGNNNSLFGTYAGYNNTGNLNSFFGQAAGLSNTSGSYNSYFGQASGYFNGTGHYNSFFGLNAGLNNTGNNNTSVGIFSLTTNTTGTFNTALGAYANVTTGILTNSTAIGAHAIVTCSDCLVLGSVSGINGGTANVKVGIGTTNPAFKLDVKNGSINTDEVYRIDSIVVLSIQGSGNLFVGTQTGLINTGIKNTFSGDSAGFFNTSGFKNSFFGDVSGFKNSAGIRNTFVGQAAGYSNTEGYANSFYGQEAGLNNTSADFNSFFGSESGRYNTIGNRNSFFGMAAGLNNSSGSSNSFFGQDVGLYNTSGNSNSFMGHEAGYANSTGFNNSFFGQTAGYSNITGSNNTAMGDSANFVSGALTNATAIGAKARVSCSNCLVLGSVNGVNGATSNVNVGIGTNNPNAPLAFGTANGKKITLFPGSQGDIGFSVHPYQLRIQGDPGTSISLGIDSAGFFRTNLDVYGNGGAWLRGTLVESSDARLKKDINPLQNSLRKVLQLNGYNYYWKDSYSEAGMQTGLIAQEVQKLFPELVKENKEGMLSVNYSGLIPVLIESIKEQQKQIDAFQHHDRKQQEEIDELKKLVLGLVAKK